jgi:hypothetical protein
MQTPVGRFFKVIPIDGVEWAISIAIGLSAVPVSVLTRILSRCVPQPCGTRPRRKRAGGAAAVSKSNSIGNSYDKEQVELVKNGTGGAE